jgi:hypothetical protein
VRSKLVLRSPSNGTGWADTRTFSAADDRALRDCLAQLSDFITDPPAERWDKRRHRRVIDADDRWKAAMLLYPDEPSERGKSSFEPQRPEAAWTAVGALRLAELLPDRLDELRADIIARFGAEPRRSGAGSLD